MSNIPRPTKSKPPVWFVKGFIAGQSNRVSRYENPYKRTDPRFHLWLAGYILGRDYR